MLMDHHDWDVVLFHLVGHGDQRAVLRHDSGRLVVVSPVTYAAKTCGRKIVRRLGRLSQARHYPADRFCPRKGLYDVQRALDHRWLIVQLVHRHLIVGMGHEFPPRITRLFGDPSIILANPRIDGEGGANAQAVEELEETPNADAHAVFVPAPVWDVRHQWQPVWRRKE